MTPTRRPTIWALGRSGRRLRNPARTRRSGSTACARSAQRCRAPWWRSEASTRAMPQSAFEPAPPVLRWSGPRAALPNCAPRSMRLSDLGELGLLAELERRGLAHEIGDDAAQLEHGLVVTQDALVAGVHFRLDWLSWRDLGWRAAAVNLSDLAASGADPEGLVVTLAAPGDTDVEDVVALYEGMAETGVPVLGGDTTESDSLVLSVSALGRSDRVPGRAGARTGDFLVVTGSLGGAGAAFRR